MRNLGIWRRALPANSDTDVKMQSSGSPERKVAGYFILFIKKLKPQIALQLYQSVDLFP